MASMPLQQSRRQSHRTNATDQTPQHELQASSNAASTTSLDSQTVYLNDVDLSSTTSHKPHKEDTAATAPPVTQPIDDDSRRCWICFSDEIEDEPGTSPWRSPCPCALTAHEACLLDWIADLESPDSTRSTSKSTKIECPQCKSPIYVARAHSYIVDAFSAFESFAGRMLLPSVMAGLGYTFILAASHHGAHSIRMVFGTHDADVILAPLRRWTIVERTALRYLPTIATPILREWRGLRVELGLPLIPGALMLSRTSFGDAVLPVLPIVFFATHPTMSETLAMGHWPPSAALTFVILPYIRSAYDEVVERVWGEKERKWIKEIKPRQAESGTDDERDVGDDDDVIQIDINIPFLDQQEEEPLPPPPAPPPPVAAAYAPRHRPRERRAAPPLHAPPTDAENEQRNEAQIDVELEAELEALADAAQNARDAIDAVEAQQQEQGNAQQAEAGQPAQAQAAGGGGVRERGTELYTLASRAGTSVVGALLFPTIAGASGELLRLLLPLAWTTARRGPKGQLLPPTGFLQTRWGRSVVGGCLFVVLKDAVRIYCRWRMAVSFRERRVREYDKKNHKLLA